MRCVASSGLVKPVYSRIVKVSRITGNSRRFMRVVNKKKEKERGRERREEGEGEKQEKRKEATEERSEKWEKAENRLEL